MSGRLFSCITPKWLRGNFCYQALALNPPRRVNECYRDVSKTIVIGDSDRFKFQDAQSVDYGRLTALLIEATKEQQTLIHKQQAQIARLTRQVKTIQATLKANGRTGSAVRTVKAEGTTVRQ